MVKMYTPWVTPTQDGRFLVQQKYVDPLKSTESHKVLAKVSITIKKDTPQAKNIAYGKLRERILNKINDQLKGTDITLQELTDKYQQHLKETDRPWNTRQRALSNYKFINKHFKGAIAKNITTPMINEYLEYCLYKRKPRTLSNASTRLRKVYLSNAYKFGIKYGLVNENPVVGVHIQWKDESKKERDKIENKYLTTEELRAILGYVKHLAKRPDYYYIFKWLSVTGMRINEAAGLTKENIKKENGLFYAYVIGNQEYHYGELYHDEEENGLRSKKHNHTKTLTSYRKVQLDNSALEIFNALKDETPENQPLFINNYFQNPWTSFTIDNYMKTIAHRLGINKKLTSHFFRHTYISVLAENGVPLPVIMSQVGQRDSDITKKIYTHVTENERLNLKNKLNNISSNIGI